MVYRDRDNQLLRDRLALLEGALSGMAAVVIVEFIRNDNLISAGVMQLMMTLLRNPLGRLRVIGIVEGASFLLLLFVAMPLKYLAGMPQYVSVVGAVHGGLWLAYLASVVDVRLAITWRWPRVFTAVAASVLPFGPFLLEPSLRAEQQEREQQSAAPATA